DPCHADALHLLGVLEHQTDHHEAAIPLIRQAIALNPAAAFYSNLGTVLQATGRMQEALACFEQAVGLDPQFVDALNNLGIALMEQGQLDEAVECYRQALRFDPDYVNAHTNLGSAYQERGQLDEAAACFEQALCLKPEAASPRWNRALLR